MRSSGTEPQNLMAMFNDNVFSQWLAGSYADDDALHRFFALNDSMITVHLPCSSICKFILLRGFYIFRSLGCFFAHDFSVQTSYAAPVTKCAAMNATAL